MQPGWPLSFQSQTLAQSGADASAGDKAVGITDTSGIKGGLIAQAGPITVPPPPGHIMVIG